MAVAPAIPLYETSTQFKHWRFSKQGLQQTRADLNAGAVARVKTKVEEERVSRYVSFIERRRTNSSTKKSARNDEAGTAPLAELPSELVSYLSVSDELSLVAFYLAKMAPLARLFHFKDSVTSTAMSYLKRFYLNNTCMDYHPKNVMLTCLFLASKTENQLVSIEAFAAKVKGATPSAVLSLEFLVSQSLRFQYKVHHAHLAAYGVFLDMQQVLEDVTVGQLETQWRKANEYALHSRMSDLELLYTPSQIALASWYLADATLLESWLFSKPIPTADHAMAHDKILELVRSIAKMISDTPKNVDVEIVKDVDKRLKICRNPEKDPNSAT